MDQWSLILEGVKGIGKFFLHPLFYLGFFYSIYLGYIRVKRERKFFHIRIQDGWFEFRSYLWNGVLLGLIFSLVIFFIGFTVPMEFIWIVGIVTFVLALPAKPSFLSPAYTMGATFWILYMLQWMEIEIPFLTRFLERIEGGIVPGVALLTGLLLLIEGLLILQKGSKNTSPKIIKSRRGLRVGVHESKRVWMIPLLLLLPEGAFKIPFDFWPVVPIGSETFSIMLVPFWIGFSQQINYTLPSEGVKTIGRRVLLLGVFTTILAGAGFWYPILTMVAIGFSILGRVLIPIIHQIKNNTQPYYFSKPQPGIVVLDIIPGSPAEKMGLKIGEIIKTVNGLPVSTEEDYYKALQKNRAYCKLEVIDHNGENRLVNRAIYEGDHHELGVLFISEDRLLSSGKMDQA